MPNHKPCQMLHSSMCVKESFDSITSYESPMKGQRVQTTVLFADIVNSTEILVKMGDEKWARLLEKVFLFAREQVAVFNGQLLSTNGDGFHACFASPQLAARCAIAVRLSMNSLGLSIRIGLHSGECLKIDEALVGLTLHIGARIVAAADADEVLLSASVKASLDGLQLKLVERGSYHLKGVPGAWQLFNYELED